MESTAWQRLICPDTPSVMGILNVTPDSFSDGGRYNTLDLAIEQAATMVADGADVIDVGGESTRPGALPVTAQQELDRVIPVIEGIRRQLDCIISVDTSSPLVMREAVAAGADFVNDVRALGQAGAVAEVAALDVPVCLMHMQGSPQTMQQNPDYTSVVASVVEFLADRIQQCVDAGISREKIIIDPGFGFGKRLEHNLALLSNLERLHALKCPMLIGVSRKSMFGQLLGRDVGDRLAGTIAATVIAAQKRCAIMRVHDVREAVDAVKMVKAMREYADE